MTNVFRTAWLISDGKAGHINQLRALAQLQSLQINEIIYDKKNNKLTFCHGFAPSENIPDMIYSIASAGKIAHKKIKKQYVNLLQSTKSIHIMAKAVRDPFFDLEVIMAHDTVQNFIPNDGQILCKIPPSLIGEQKLNTVGSMTANLKTPFCAVLLGGGNSAFTFSDNHAFKLGKKLQQIHKKHNINIAITPSRRTDKTVLEALKAGLGEVPYFLWDGTGENPYSAMLDQALAIIVTEDSISMISDAIHTQKPVFIAQMPVKKMSQLFGKEKKYRRYNQQVVIDGFARWLDESDIPPHLFEPKKHQFTAELSESIIDCLRP